MNDCTLETTGRFIDQQNCVLSCYTSLLRSWISRGMERKPLAEKHNYEPHKMESISKTSYWLLTLVIYLSVAANGFIDNMRSVTYPDIMQELHLDHVHYGMLQSLGQFSYLIWALLAAFSMPHIGFKATFSISLVITIIGSVLTIFTSNFWLLVQR